MTKHKKTVSMSTVKPKKESRSVLGRWWLVFGSGFVDDTACATKEEADECFSETCHEAIVEVIAVTEHDRVVAELYESESIKLSHIEDLELRVFRLESELATARKVIERLREQRNELVALVGGGPNAYRSKVDSFDAEIDAISGNK